MNKESYTGRIIEGREILDNFDCDNGDKILRWKPCGEEGDCYSVSYAGVSRGMIEDSSLWDNFASGLNEKESVSFYKDKTGASRLPVIPIKNLENLLTRLAFNHSRNSGESIFDSARIVQELIDYGNGKKGLINSEEGLFHALYALTHFSDASETGKDEAVGIMFRSIEAERLCHLNKIGYVDDLGEEDKSGINIKRQRIKF